MNLGLRCLVRIFGAVMAAFPAVAADLTVFPYPVLDVARGAPADGAARPVLIVGCRNGTFSGAVAVESAEPIRGLRASLQPASAAPGGRSLPAGPGERVTLRYAVPWSGGEGLPPGLDVLLESPPEEIGVAGKSARAGVWVTIAAPADLPPGSYFGTLRVAAEGAAERAVPVEFRVADWALPPPAQWRTWIEMMQSPDTLALEYGVEPWSERHWDLIGRSFRLMSVSGAGTVYAPVLRQTNQGNEHGMIRFVRARDGALRPDFTILECYLDVAQRNLGRIQQVVIYLWDAYLATEHRGRRFDEEPKVTAPEGSYEHSNQLRAWRQWKLRAGGVMVTIVDAATGTVEEGWLPPYSDERSGEIWTPFFAELRERMRRRGLEDALRLGTITDLEPSKQDAAFLQQASGGIPWVAHSHYCRIAGAPHPNKALGGVASVAYEAHAYSLIYNVNPELSRGTGWRLPALSAYLCRFGLLNGHPLRVRQMPEVNITGRQRGVGRLGGDFWNVIRDARGRRRGQVFERYPHNHWRGLNINNWFLAPGPDGPVATARLENLREGVQECEARIFLEEALLDEAARARLGGELAGRIRAALDERHLAMWRSYWPDDEQLKLLGRIEGRSMHEAIWGGLGKAGVKLPDFWDGAARALRDRYEREGPQWFAQSDWQGRAAALFQLAGEAQRRLGR